MSNEHPQCVPETKIRPATLARMSDVPFRKPEPVTTAPEPTRVERRRMARAPIADGQRRVSGIEFPVPEHLPRASDILEGLPAAVRAICARELAKPDADFKPALQALADHIPAWQPSPPCDLASMIANGEHANLEVHDQFFRITRIPGIAPAIYLQGLLRTLLVFRSDLEENPSSLDDDKIKGLAQALTAAVAIGLGMPVTIAPFEWTRPAAALHADYPVRRWIRGHQVFTALTQVLVFAFDAMDACVSAGDDDGLAQAADLAALAMQACATSLEYTGDFPKQVYNEVIRVSMVSPFQPDGFSGLLSEDHRHLVKRMKLTRPVMDLLRARMPERHARIVAALGNVYESHKFVCGRFVGADKPSLLMVRETGRSAVEQLDRFKATRLRAVGADQPEQTA